MFNYLKHTCWGSYVRLRKPSYEARHRCCLEYPSCYLFRHAFGIKSDVKDNIHYIDDVTVAYPVGRNVVIYNTQSNTQKFITGAEKTGMLICYDTIFIEAV